MKLQRSMFFTRAGAGGRFRTISTSLSLILMLMTFGVNAANAVKSDPLAKVDIRLTGTVTAMSCTVDPLDADKTVELGDWNTKQIIHPPGYTTPVPFSIHLTGCSTSGVSLVFNGEKDTTDNTLLALGDGSTATGVAIEIMDAAHKRIDMGNKSEPVKVDNNGNAVLDFSARYVSVASPTGGTAFADSEFTLTYD